MTKINFVDLTRQRKAFNGKIEKAAAAVIESGQFINGPDVLQLGNELADFAGVKHAVPCSSGTDAILLSLMALNVKPGDEILVPAFTFIATASMVSFYHAVPVFVDVDPQSMIINAEEARKKITPKTVGIIPVSLFGQCYNADSINALANEHNLWVLEDAAQSFGAEYKGRKSCSLSSIATTSFFPAKPLGCYGDGGAVFTNDDNLASNVRLYLNHGQEKRYYHSRIGINGRMDTIQAAVIRVKLEYYSKEIELRNNVAEMYTKRLSSYVETPSVPEDQKSVWAQYTIRSDKRDKIKEKLAEKNIPSAIHYPMTLPQQEAFKYLNISDIYPVAEKLSKTVLSLPMHPYLTEEEINYICSTVIDVFE